MLSEEIRAALRKFPSAQLKENGQAFFDTCLSDVALCYGLEQVMRAKQRVDPEHFDGGASLIHAGLTLWGKRTLEFQTADGEWSGEIDQEPGSFYVGNMCAVNHRVRHLPEDLAEPLFRGHGGAGVHLTVMLRTDVFKHKWARRGKHKPRPEDVFDAVNDIVARKLAREPWILPRIAECMARMEE